MFGYPFYRRPTNDGVAPIDIVEPDPFICACEVSVPTRTEPKGKVKHCWWYEKSRKSLDNLTAKGKALPENVSSDSRVSKHLRLAMKLQAAGYKGSTHPKAMEHAAKERDSL